jgi:hypothetical protein
VHPAISRDGVAISASAADPDAPVARQQARDGGPGGWGVEAGLVL